MDVFPCRSREAVFGNELFTNEATTQSYNTNLNRKKRGHRHGGPLVATPFQESVLVRRSSGDITTLQHDKVE